jgi:hypothetical protein
MPPTSKRNPARRNKSVTRSTLTRDHDIVMPDLPPAADIDGWHPLTLQWWVDIWASPMAPEFDKSDIHGLYILAALVDKFWWNPSKDTAAEIRLQRVGFGLTPIDRRRLQWEIERTEDAQEKGARRRAARKPTAVDADALGALRAV